MRNEKEELEELPEWVKIVNKISNKNPKKRLSKQKNLSLEDLVFRRLQELHQPMFPDQIIRFPLVFSKICPILCLTKDQAWLILKKLEKFGIIEIVPYQGIKIRKDCK